MLRILLAIVCSLLAVFSIALPVSAESPQASQWFERMSRSQQELDYIGSFTYERGDSIESLRISHAVKDGEQLERLEHLSGQHREVRRQGNQLQCFLPGYRLVRQHIGAQASSGQDALQGLLKHYRISFGDRDRVAGRAVVVLDIEPRDTHRFAHRLSIDEQSGLLLRSEMFGPGRNTLERFQFVGISFDRSKALSSILGASSSHIKSQPALTKEPTAGASNRAQGLPVWQVNWLPGGFVDASPNRRYIDADMSSYSDGLSVFSVFMEPISAIDSAEGRTRKGATTAYSRAVLLDAQPFRVTVVGEIPTQTAQLVAQSVSLMGER